MFNKIIMEDTIRIDPTQFGLPLEKAAIEELRGKYEGLVDEELGYVIMVVNLDVNSVGRIIPGDGGTHHLVTFSILTFFPELQEVMEKSASHYAWKNDSELLLTGQGEDGFGYYLIDLLWIDLNGRQKRKIPTKSDT